MHLLRLFCLLYYLPGGSDLGAITSELLISGGYFYFEKWPALNVLSNDVYMIDIWAIYYF